ncbi:sigma-70 family RNA polymerase sigma factor [Propionibacteriaceae bacterium Y2011]|uniref:sigma-70 family RNA polymerase sigma factor n=1 Tax=Microlunatus sp. Y2014 TaxID=3418488 RepID=UPI003B4BB7B1
MSAWTAPLPVIPSPTDPSPFAPDRSGDERQLRTERTAALYAELGTGTEERDAELLDAVVVCNLPVAVSLAHRYSRRGEEDDDLVQVAELALVEAAHRFDPDRGDFLAFAVPTILGSLKRHFRDQGWTIRPPRRLQELQTRLNRAWPELAQSLGRTPTNDELAAAVDGDAHDVSEAAGTRDCYRPASLDATVFDGAPLSTTVAQQEDGFDVVDVVTTLGPACRRLSPTDRQLLWLRFFEERTQREIAEEFGVSQMHISRSLARILAELRDLVTDEPEPQAS